MRIRLSYITSIVFTLILLSGCKHFEYEPYFEVPPAPLEDITAYSYFKTGTYWIYKDSASALEDSVYVFADTNYLYHQTNTTQAEGDYMFYGYRAYSNYDSCVYYYSISMGYYIIETKEVGVLLKKYKGPNYIGATYTMTNRFVEGDHIIYYAAQGMTYYKDYYDSLQILSNSFHKVSKFHSTINETMENSPTNFYIAKNIGIIRKEKLNTSQTWNLIRYHIVQ